MQINTSHQAFTNDPRYSANPTKAVSPLSAPKEEARDPEPSLPPLGELPRQTYGLAVLEQMSDEEYRAFLRATAEMSESEKIFAAQSLYRLNETYRKQGKNPYQSYPEQEFIQSYQNAYNALKS